MGNEITVRAGGEDDVDHLASLSESVQQLHVAQRPDVFKTVDPQALRDLFRRRLADPTARIWIAERAGVVIGYAVTVDKHQEEGVLAYARSWREIEEIAVRAEHRRRGAAGALLRQIEISTQADGIAVLELNTWTFNDAARNSFERLGFAPKNIRYERWTRDS